MSGSIETFEDLPGWGFEIEEISAGIYRVKGTDKAGRGIEATGTDLDALLDDCRRYARTILDANRR